VPFNEAFVGVFRVDYKSCMPYLHFGRSKDATSWEIEHERIELICEDKEIAKMDYAYYPRVCKVEDTYYITWCNCYHGPTIGPAKAGSPQYSS